MTDINLKNLDVLLEIADLLVENMPVVYGGKEDDSEWKAQTLETHNGETKKVTTQFRQSDASRMFNENGGDGIAFVVKSEDSVMLRIFNDETVPYPNMIRLSGESIQVRDTKNSPYQEIDLDALRGYLPHETSQSMTL